MLNAQKAGRATAAASVNADAAIARDAAVSSAAPGTGAQQGTVYTGDVIQGKKVISALSHSRRMLHLAGNWHRDLPGKRRMGRACPADGWP